MLSFFVNLLALAVPVFTLQVYDRVIFSAGLTTLQGLVIGMAIVLLFDFILRQTRGRLMQRASLRIDVAVGNKLFNKILALPMALLRTAPTPTGTPCSATSRSFVTRCPVRRRCW